MLPALKYKADVWCIIHGAPQQRFAEVGKCLDPWVRSGKRTLFLTQKQKLYSSIIPFVAQPAFVTLL